MADVMADPLVAGQLMHIGDPHSDLTVTLPAPPVGEAPPLSFPPRLGEHNQEVYGQALGYTTETLADLGERGVV